MKRPRTRIRKSHGSGLRCIHRTRIAGGAMGQDGGAFAVLYGDAQDVKERGEWPFEQVQIFSVNVSGSLSWVYKQPNHL